MKTIIDSTSNKERRLFYLLLIALLGTIICPSSAEAEKSWFVEGVFTNSRSHASSFNYSSSGLANSGTVVGGIIQGGSVITDRTRTSDRIGIAFQVGRTVLSSRLFSLSLGSGYQSSPDIGLKSIPFDAEIRYKAPFKLNDFSPFFFAEAGIFYGFIPGQDAQDAEKTFLDDFAIDRQPLGDRVTQFKDGLGTNFALGLGVQRSIGKRLSYELSLSGRYQVLPEDLFAFSPSRDFPGLVLPLGAEPEPNSLERDNTLTSFSMTLGLRF